MKLEIDMPEHHYNNIIAFDSVRLGRVPYKGIIIYAINAIKRGKALEQEPTTKHDLAVDCVARQDVERYIEGFINEYTPKEELEFINLELDGLKHIPSVTPQEPRKGHWKEEFNDLEGEVRFICSSCGKYQLFGTDFCYHCGSDNREVEE